MTEATRDLGLAEAMAVRALHVAARIALRKKPVREAFSLVIRCARVLSPVQDRRQARAVDRLLGGSGSCLSRAMTTAALFPGAHLVIGVDSWNSARVAAHAWVELDGALLDQTTGGEFVFGEIVRVSSGRGG